MKKSLAITLVTSIGVMGVNFVTGILVARLLEPSGRGEIAAIITWAQMLAWLVLLGFGEATAYLQAQRPQDGSRIFGTGVLVSLLLGTLGIGISWLVLPTAFAAQPSAELHLAKVFMVTIYLGMTSHVFSFLSAGDHDFRLVNFVRIAQPISYAIGLVVLWQFHAMTASHVLAIYAASTFLTTAVNFAWLLRRVGFGWPSMAIAREGLAYGLRLQGSAIGSLGNTRLDIMLMPAILSSTEIGLYSVATNLATTIFSLLNSLSWMVFPMATRAGQELGMLMIMRTARFVLFAGGALGIMLFLSAPLLLHLFYGHEFSNAVLPLRILIPGTVLLAVSGILSSGLQAINRPQDASYAQLTGLIVTLIGLSYLLRPFGIVGAAVTSTTSYAICCLGTLIPIMRQQAFSIYQVISIRGFADDIVQFVSRTKPRAVTTSPS